jgi:CheY-like chemotaxis protein
MEDQRILVAEDDLFLRELYVDILSGEGYKVESAADGETALEKMKIGGYNLVLLDIIMPKMDGLTVMKQMQNNQPQAPNKCVVFLTNLDKDEEIRTALQLGNGYLIKSQITPGSLVEQVKIYLDKYKSGDGSPPDKQL